MPMVGWRKAALSRATRAALSVLGIVVSLSPAGAQYVNNLCGTAQGYCVVYPAPVGTGCGCMTPAGPVPGAIVPPGAVYAPQQMQAISDTCRTVRGICQTYPSPIGSACNCFGDPGTVIPR
ncbi:MAG: hypothetical protein JSR21_05050 [Proteobacteria bacterium]|nr:hypothetical protein [Pseudomonadota bacterium]